MSDTNPGHARRPWGRIVLFTSLAFNLLVVGLVAGALLHGPRDRDRNPMLRDLGFGPFVQALPRADRAAMSDAIKREAGSFRENRAELRRQFDAFLDALRADPYDPAQLQTLIAAQSSRIGERQRIGQKLLLERIGAMDADARAAYADALRDRIRWRRPRHD